MSEALTTGPQIETGQLTPNQAPTIPAAAEIFDVKVDISKPALDAASTMVSHTIEVDSVSTEPKSSEEQGWVTDEHGYSLLPGASIKTTLPREFFDVDPYGALYMSAESLDGLSVGDYVLAGDGSTSVIKITEVDGNKYVTSTSSRNSVNHFADTPTEIVEKRVLPPTFGKFSFNEALAVQLHGNDKEGKGGVKLLKNILGYSFDFDAGQRTIPTPQTIEYFAKKSNMPIKLIRETNKTGTIPMADYLGSFAEGQYPVGTGDLAVYAHDVRSNDHMVGVTVLGREGLAMLAPLAERALRPMVSDEEKIAVAEYFDRATQAISRIIDQPSDQDFIDLFDGIEGNNAKIVADLIALCTKTRELSDKFDAGIDAQALLDYLKSRLATLHADYELGDEYDDFLKQLSVTELPERTEHVPASTGEVVQVRIGRG